MTKRDQQNTPPEDALVITISDTSLGSNGHHCVEFEDAPDAVPVSSSNSVIIGTPEVITLEDELADPESELKVTSSHVATSMKEEATTSFASAGKEDLVEGMSNLLSQQ